MLDKRRESQRPRLAGQARLSLPADVSVVRVDSDWGSAGDIVGRFGAEAWDPFGRTEDRLLLAESFARFDFSRPRKAQAWFARHGVIDLGRIFAEEPIDSVGGRGNDRFQDAHSDLVVQQRLVRWHLDALARLTEHRERALPPRPGWRPHEGWDPAWSQPAIEDASGEWVLSLGGASRYEIRIAHDMRRYPSYESITGSPDIDDLIGWESGLGPDEITGRWWPAARVSWERIEARGIPVLWVPLAAWDRYWDTYAEDPGEPRGDSPTGRLSADWHGLLELERRLIEPFVRPAPLPEVSVERKVEGGPLVVRQRQHWTSVLAPIYLQLLEALLRISEGKSGAIWCRHCGQPLLTLDARRAVYCNDRHRSAHTQRMSRLRREARERP